MKGRERPAQLQLCIELLWLCFGRQAERSDRVRLTDDGRKLVLTEWQESRQREWSHQLLGRAVPAALLPSVQARLLARHLRGELPSYMPWLVR